LKTILGIDIGSSKTVALIADISDKATITGVGIKRSKGIKKGFITNIEQASHSIKQAVSDAKRIAGVTDVSKAVVSISSAYTQSKKSSGLVNIPTGEITIGEINRALQTAVYNAEVPDDFVVLQAIPYNFKVDDNSEIEDPEGMRGNRLKVDAHVVIAQKAGIENLKKMFAMAGINIENIVLSSFASAIATLNEDEKIQGVALIDIGATTSDLIIFKDNAIRWTEFVGVGSYHITNDLAMALHTPIIESENIKLNISKWSNEDIIEVPLIGDEDNTQSVNIATIKEIMFARINETLMILNQLIEKSGFKNHITGVVLTGGFTNLENLRETAISIFGNMSVRIAKPQEVNGLFENLKAPEFSTAVGLVLYALGKHSNYETDSNRKFRSKRGTITEEQITMSEDIQNGLQEGENLNGDIKQFDPKEREQSFVDKLKIMFKGLFQ
jgi:cell division protein FtsA